MFVMDTQKLIVANPGFHVANMLACIICIDDSIVICPVIYK